MTVIGNLLKKIPGKTIAGVLTAAVGIASSPDVLNLLPHGTADIVLKAGALLSILGIRYRSDDPPTS